MQWYARNERQAVALTVNGRIFRRWIEPRMLLSDFLRDELGLTGTHVGCEHGVCGACTILIDGVPARSCLQLARAMTGKSITTIEGIAHTPEFERIKTAFSRRHALQCGFCTPGIVVSVWSLGETSSLGAQDVEDVLGGHLCRCTGYVGIKKAVYELLDEAVGGNTDAID